MYKYRVELVFTRTAKKAVSKKRFFYSSDSIPDSVAILEALIELNPLEYSFLYDNMYTIIELEEFN